MVKTNETVCICDICGKKMFESETGHERYQTYLVLGSNRNESDTMKFYDVCDNCAKQLYNIITQNTIYNDVNRKAISRINDLTTK